MFEFTLPTKIVAGPNVINRIGEFVKAYGDRVLLVTDNITMQEMGYLSRVKRFLEDESHGVLVYNKIASNSDSEVVNRGADQARHARCNVVVGFGGRTTLNIAKAIAFLISHEGNLEDYFLSGKGQKKKIAYIEVPSSPTFLPGLSLGFYVKDKYDGVKKSVENPLNYAEMVLIDPKLSITLGKEYTGAIGIDILSLAIEAYLSKHSTPISDAFAVKAIELIGLYLLKAVQDPENVNYRSQLSTASIMASMAVANSTPGSGFALSLALNSVFGVYQPMTSAILLPHLLEFNLTAAANRYVQIAKAFGENVEEITVVEAAIKAIEHIRKITFTLKLAQSLSELDINKNELESVAKIARNYDFLHYLPRPVSKDDFYNILIAASSE